MYLSGRLTRSKDTDQGGNITVDEFARVMRKTNPSISDDEVSKIVSEVDLDGDRTINFDGKMASNPSSVRQHLRA